MPMTIVPMAALHPEPAHHRVVRSRAGVRGIDAWVIEMVPGHLDHQQSARRERGIGFVKGGLPGVGHAGLFRETTLHTPELAIVVGARRCLQIGFAVEVAFEKGALQQGGRLDRQAARLGHRLQHPGDRTVQAHIRQDKDLRQFEVRARQHFEEVGDDARRVIAVEQRRAQWTERAGPAAHHRNAEGGGGPFDGKGNEQPQAGLLLRAVPDDREAHFAILQPGHGGRQEARIEEQVRLDRAGAQIVEFLDQREAGRRLIDAEAPR